MARRRRAFGCFALSLVLLFAAGAAYTQASASGCGSSGCVDVGMAVFDPYAPPDGPGYSLMRTADGARLRYDPCQPIHFVVNPDGAPSTWGADVSSATKLISFATGLTFIDDGLTRERPTRARAPEQVARYGHRWAPVLVAWAQPGVTDLVPAGTAGSGGSFWARSGPHPPVLVTGVVVLDAAISARLQPGADGRLTHGRLLAHEFGHLVGLGHSADPASLMAADVGWSPTALSDGDFAGLAQLGIARGCLAAPDPPRH